MADSFKDIEKVAKLSAIKISDEEKEHYSTALGKIFSVLDLLKSIDTTGIEPLNNIMEGGMPPLRDDLAMSSDKDEIFSSMKNMKHDYFTVPKFVE